MDRASCRRSSRLLGCASSRCRASRIAHARRGRRSSMTRTFVWHRTRGPKKTEPVGAPTKGRVLIEQVRSGIGHPKKLRATLDALGLRHHQDVVVKQDSASLGGMIKHVRHLVKVTPVKE